jgi:hypothetical protein
MKQGQGCIVDVFVSQSIAAEALSTIWAAYQEGHYHETTQHFLIVVLGILPASSCDATLHCSMQCSP